MSSRLYVGSLSSDTTDETVREVFAARGFAVVAVRFVTNQSTGCSRGFAFVELAGKLDAARAIATIRDLKIDEHAAVLKEAPDVTWLHRTPAVV